MTNWQLQAPDEIAHYEITWEELDTGESIEESTWFISPDEGLDTGANLGNEIIDTSGQITQVTVSSLVVGKTYQLKNFIRTTEGRTMTQEVTIRCANK